ncbi:MAG: GAF domain-containing protein, partial [Caldilineae bacterium]
MSQNATLSPSQQWQIFNEATVELAQARTAEEIVKTTARSLNRLGLHVLGGSLDDTQTRFTIRFVSPAPNTDPAFLPFLHSLSALAGQTLTVPTSDTAHTLIHHKTMTMASLARLVAWLGPAGEAVRQAFAAASAPPMEAALAPIRVADRVRYVFGLASPTLTADDIPLITAFTNLASTILDKLTLLQHTEAQKKRADTLREVSSIVNSSLDLNTVLSLILEQLAKVIPYDSAAILLERDNFLKLEAGAGFAQDEPVLDIRVPADTNLLYQEMKQTRRPILINNVRADPRYVVWAGASPVRAWIGVPLLWKDRIIGQISIDSFKENAFTEADVELAFVFAQQVAAAIQNATLFDESVRTTRELQALLESARDVTSTLDTEEVIRLTAERVKELMHAQRVTVYLQNGESNTLKAVVDLDDSGEELSLPPGEQIARQAIAARESIIANPVPTPAGEPSGAQVAVPFVVKDRAIGAIAMARPPAAPFRQSDLDLLTRFALQTGIAIENSNLYKQVENRLKRRELLNRLARRLSSKLSLEALALDIMQTAVAISDADAAAVALVDPSNESRFLQFTHNLPGEPLPTHTNRLPAMAKQAFEKQQVIATNRLAEEAGTAPPWAPEDIKGAVAVPLTTGDRPLGVLGLFTFERPFSQSHEVLNTLEAIG